MTDLYILNEDDKQALRNVIYKIRRNNSDDLPQEEIIRAFKDYMSTFLKPYFFVRLQKDTWIYACSSSVKDKLKVKIIKQNSKAHVLLSEKWKEAKERALIRFNHDYAALPLGVTLYDYEMQEFDRDEQTLRKIRQMLKLEKYYYVGLEITEALPSLVELIQKKLETVDPVIAKRADIIEYPLDKPNSIIWNLLEQDTKGQIAFHMEKKGSTTPLYAYYAINFDKLEDVRITKRLTPFDKRVYIAISALFNAGNHIITLSQIYYAMGGTSDRPNGRTIQKINTSVSKMRKADIFLDNAKEAAVYNYSHFEYDGPLLPIERVTEAINGKVSNAAIHLFREPPMMTFAKLRKQITTLNVKLLQSPVDKTDANLQLEDLLLERIGHNKRQGKSFVIKFEWIFEKINIEGKTEKEKKARQRLPNKIKAYLTYYSQEGFIKSFKIDEGKGIIKIFCE